jgi:hypothetical protein
MGFGLMTGYIGLFDTARDCTLHITVAHTLVSTVTSSLLLLVAASNSGRSPTSVGSWPHLPASHSNSSQ